MTESRTAAGKSARQSRALWIAAAIALVHTGWALFQWYELVVSRSGGEIICGPGGGHCAEVWDSPFASAVHARTGLPVAAWGGAWSIAALALPLVAPLRIARRRVAEPRAPAPLRPAADRASARARRDRPCERAAADRRVHRHALQSLRADARGPDPAPQGLRSGRVLARAAPVPARPGLQRGHPPRRQRANSLSRRA